MFVASDWSIPLGDILGQEQRDEIGEVKGLEHLAKLRLALRVGPGVMIRLSVEHCEIVGNVLPGTQSDNAKNRIGKDTFVHHDVDNLNPLLLVHEEGDWISVFIVR